MGEECRPIIVIRNDEFTFSSNNSIRKAWTQISDRFLQPKGRGQRILVSKFYFFFGRLNFFSLPENSKKKMIEKAEITITKAVVLFEYRKANERY